MMSVQSTHFIMEVATDNRNEIPKSHIISLLKRLQEKATQILGRTALVEPIPVLQETFDTLYVVSFDTFTYNSTVIT